MGNNTLSHRTLCIDNKLQYSSNNQLITNDNCIDSENINKTEKSNILQHNSSIINIKDNHKNNSLQNSFQSIKIYNGDIFIVKHEEKVKIKKGETVMWKPNLKKLTLKIIINIHRKFRFYHMIY